MNKETLSHEVIQAKSLINHIASMSYKENLPIHSLFKINNYIKNIICNRKIEIEEMNKPKYKFDSEDEDEDEN